MHASPSSDKLSGHISHPAFGGGPPGGRGPAGHTDKAAIYASRDRRPPMLPVNWSGIPDSLKAHESWVGWELRWSDQRAAWSKVPVSFRSLSRAKGWGKARSDAPVTWCSFAKAKAEYDTHGAKLAAGVFRPQLPDGIGFVFDRAAGVFGVDVDGCRDATTGELTPLGRDIVARLPGYWEASPSKTGLKGFFRGQIPDEWLGGRTGRKVKVADGQEVEVYREKRYFAVTGHRIPEATNDVTTVDAEVLAAWLNELAPPEAPKPSRTAGTSGGRQSNCCGDATNTSTTTPTRLSDAQVLDKLLARAKNAAENRALWTGDTSRQNNDHSGADQALANKLAFYCGGDRHQMDRLFRESGLYRPKWDEFRGVKTYGEMTIDKALASHREFYSPTPRPTAAPFSSVPDDFAEASEPTKPPASPGWAGLDGPRWTDPINPPVCEAGCRVRCGCVGELPLQIGRVVPRQDAEEDAPPGVRLMRLIGPQQVFPADCPNRFLDHFIGDNGTEVFVEAGCDAWSCNACQTRRRWLEKHEHCPILFRHGTHVFEGTATAWTNLALRLKRAGVCFEFRWVMAGLTQRTVFLVVTSDPDNILADIPEIETCRGIEAATRYAACVDALPAALPKGMKKSWQSRGWDHQDEVPTPETQGGDPGADESDLVAAPAKVKYTRSIFVVVRPLDEIAAYMQALGVPRIWGVFQSEHQGGAVHRSLGLMYPDDPDGMVLIRLVRRFALRHRAMVDEQAAALLGGATDEPIPD